MLGPAVQTHQMGGKWPQGKRTTCANKHRVNHLKMGWM